MEIANNKKWKGNCLPYFGRATLKFEENVGLEKFHLFWNGNSLKLGNSSKLGNSDVTLLTNILASLQDPDAKYSVLV